MKVNKKYCWALDLVDNPTLIREYETYHENVWPEIVESIKDSGIEELEIFRVENRLFMVMRVNDSFSIEKKTEMDSTNERVQEWESLMWKYQKALPNSKPGEKWRLMERIFSMK